MSYTRLNLADGELIDESVFTHIEDGIEDSFKKSCAIVKTDYSYNQSQMDTYGAKDYSGTWTVKDPKDYPVGSYIIFSVYNTARASNSFIFTIVTAQTSIAVQCTTIGIVEKDIVENIFKNIKVGSTNITASANSDTLTFAAGSNVTLTPSGKTITIAATDTKYTHPNSGVTAGTYRSVTVNAQGHITAGTNPTTLAAYGLSTEVSNLIDSKINALDAAGVSY